MEEHDAGGEPPVPTAETLLFFASRAQLVARVVTPALAAGTWVLCDRFGDSTLAYQGYGRGLPLEELARIQSFATGGLEPDLTVLLDLPVAAGRRRLAARNGSAAAGDRFEHVLGRGEADVVADGHRGAPGAHRRVQHEAAIGLYRTAEIDRRGAELGIVPVREGPWSWDPALS